MLFGTAGVSCAPAGELTTAAGGTTTGCFVTFEQAPRTIKAPMMRFLKQVFMSDR